MVLFHRFAASIRWLTDPQLFSTTDATRLTTKRMLSPGGDARQNVRAAFVELASLTLLVEGIEWIAPVTDHPRAVYEVLALLIVALLIVCFARDGVSARDLGIRLDNIWAVLARISVPLFVFVLITVAVGLAAGTLRFGMRFYSMLLSVPFWAFLQQYMLLAYANRRLRVIVEGKSILATAVFFAVLHLPNPVLTLVCALGGYIWAREYEREPNLLANALTHAISSAFLANSIPAPLLKNMVVGYNYFFR
ncbi:MAG TPA: CPBP family intramembrane glutamic endopeptidase [Blastocatellia bacterium]|nr:CPBP family intramembrane glutamic endopeptidase [Blastocatellia bacterium]